MVIYGIKWKCEGPSQAADIERFDNSETGQGV